MLQDDKLQKDEIAMYFDLTLEQEEDLANSQVMDFQIIVLCTVIK